MAEESHSGTATSDAHGHSPAAATSFAPADVEKFQADDRHAAGAIALLMVSIFTMGLVGYFAIAIWVW
jgi:hypothetical protein